MKKQKWKTVFISLKKTFTIIWQYKKSYVFLSVLVNILQGILPIISVKVLQRIVNHIQTKNVSFEEILYWIIIYVSVGCVLTVISEIYSYYFSKFSMNFAKFIDKTLIQKAMNLTLLDFEDSKTYNTINRAQVESGSSLLAYFESFLYVMKGSTSLITSVFVISDFELWIIPIILIIPSIQYLYSLRIARRQFDITIARTGKERQVWYIEFLAMTGKAFKEIRLNGLKEYFLNKYDKLKKEMMNQDLKLLKEARNINLFLSLSEQSVSGGIIAYLLYCGYKKVILIGDMTTYITCMDNVKNNLVFILTQIKIIFQKSLSVELFHTYLEMPEKDFNIGEEIEEIKTIELKNVSYKYRNSHHYALTNINLTIELGKVIALLGENGSGKSTLIKIILGFYDDYEGEIYINNIDMRNINMKSYYSKISCVFQDYIKFETTLRENVAYGDVGRVEKEDEIEEALLLSELNKSIYKKNGLDTFLGNWFGEKELSSGEWQRIAIARAFFKKSDLYILDEPDASLDVVIEEELLRKYKKKLSESMGIFITHKISHAKEVADQIVVLKNGRIIQSGTHDYLIENEGMYKKLYNLHKKK